MSPSTSTNFVATEDLEILDQEIDEVEAIYRVRAGKRVHYMSIFNFEQLFDLETVCQPPKLIPKLPPFPDSDWTEIHISQSSNGEMESTTITRPLKSIRCIWHPRSYDVLSLKRVASYMARTKEVKFENRTALAKIANFEVWISLMEDETEVYESISTDLQPGETPIAPQFLGHLTEQGRCIGFLLEMIEHRYPTKENYPACEQVLRRLHKIGWIHGDVNRYNFLIEESTGHVKMVDFEHSEPYDEAKAKLEIEQLHFELHRTDIGRGCSTMIGEDGQEEVCGPIYYCN